MPIKASADKLKRELADFGYPPKFSEVEETVEETSSAQEVTLKDKSKGKKVRKHCPIHKILIDSTVL